MQKLQLKENKTLKLHNVLVREMQLGGDTDQNKIIHMMSSWIRNSGNEQIGPLISHSSGLIGMKENGLPIIKTSIMMQLRNKANFTDQSYKFVEEIRIENCIFVRFQDKAENLSYAFSKINLLAYENNIKLKGCSYTVFVNGEDAGNIVADVFMPIEEKDVLI